jgi:hypothetical protein
LGIRSTRHVAAQCEWQLCLADNYLAIRLTVA